MEGLVVLGFLLIPVAGGIMAAAPIFGVAFILNLSLRRHLVASKVVHLVAVACLAVYFVIALSGELGRNLAFIIAFIIGASICYLIYVFLLKKINKPKEAGQQVNVTSGLKCQVCGEDTQIS